MSSSQPRSLHIMCARCKVQNDFKACVVEREAPYPYDFVIQGLTICPSCGLENHIYFLNKATIEKRKEIQHEMYKLSPVQTLESFRKVQVLRDKSQALFDQDQLLYGHLLEKVAAEDGRPE